MSCGNFFEKPNSAMNADDVISILEEYPEDLSSRIKIIDKLRDVIFRLENANKVLNYRCKPTNEHRQYDSISEMLKHIVKDVERAQIAEKFREKGIKCLK